MSNKDKLSLFNHCLGLEGRGNTQNRHAKLNLEIKVNITFYKFFLYFHFGSSLLEEMCSNSSHNPSLLLPQRYDSTSAETLTQLPTTIHAGDPASLATLYLW